MKQETGNIKHAEANGSAGDPPAHEREARKIPGNHLRTFTCGRVATLPEPFLTEVLVAASLTVSFQGEI